MSFRCGCVAGVGYVDVEGLHEKPSVMEQLEAAQARLRAALTVEGTQRNGTPLMLGSGNAAVATEPDQRSN